MITKSTLAMFVLSALLWEAPATARDVTLLNVSYDPTRELYHDFNAAFAKFWKGKTGDDVKVNQSHGGSGKQARAVIDGPDADVVTLASPTTSMPSPTTAASCPKTGRRSCWSTPRLHVDYRVRGAQGQRQGNQRVGTTWSGRTSRCITPNPKTSGARLELSGRVGIRDNKFGGDKSKIRDFVSRLYKNVPVLDSGARGATTTFAQRGLGDVLIAWENEAFLLVDELGKDKFEIVSPVISVLAEPPVAVVEKNAAKHGTNDVARAYSPMKRLEWKLRKRCCFRLMDR